jgi:hypothetical protein
MSALALQPGWLQAGALQMFTADRSPVVPGPIRLPHPGRPAPFPTLLIAVFDDSGSVTGPAGSDPLSGRYDEARQAFSAIARRGSTHELGAVVHFDTPCSGDVDPLPILRRTMLALRAALQVPPDASGSSELGSSVLRAHELAAAHPDHRSTLVVFSDFQLFDADPAAVLRDLAAFPGEVHAVVLGGRLPQGVLDARIQRTDITHDHPRGALALALFGSLTTHRRGNSGGPVRDMTLSIPQRQETEQGRRRLRQAFQRRPHSVSGEASSE